MGLKLYEETSVQAIADAIRTKNGSSDTYTISEMSAAIENIPSGGSGEIYKYHWSNDGKICVREGLGEVKWFFKGLTFPSDSYDIAVPRELYEFLPKTDVSAREYPNDSSTTFTGYIAIGVSSAFPTPIFRNYDTGWNGYPGATVYGVIDINDGSAQMTTYTDPLDIPDIDISLIEKTITENGTYSAEDDGYVGYSDVVVNIDRTPIALHRILYDTWHIYNASQGWTIGGKNYLSYVYKVDANKTYLILFGDVFSGNILNVGFSTTDNWAESKSLTKVVMLSSPTNGSGIFITTEEDGYIVADVGENTNYGNILEIYCYEMPTTSDMNGFNPASINWDFTNSLESNTGIAVVLHGVTRLSTGISIDSATNSYIEIPIGLTPKFIYEIDISDAVWSGDTSAHGRLIMNTTDSYGFIWRYHSQQWGYYDGYWVMDEDPSTHTEVTNPNAFDNKTLKMLFDSSNILSVYADETLVYRSTRAININYNAASVTIGSSSASFNSMNITGLRIYPNINR